MKKSLAILILLSVPLAFAADSDRDGIEDGQDRYPYDFDNDGMTDEWENRNGLRYDIVDSRNDPDNDGLSNLDEFAHGTDPNSADSDGDNLDDYREINELGTDPLRKNMSVWAIALYAALGVFLLVMAYLTAKYRKRIAKKYRDYFTAKKPPSLRPAQPIRQYRAVPRQAYAGRTFASGKPAYRQKAAKKPVSAKTLNKGKPLEKLKKLSGGRYTKKEVFERLRSIKK